MGDKMSSLIADSLPLRADNRRFANEIEAREIAIEIGVAFIEKRLLFVLRRIPPPADSP